VAKKTKPKTAAGESVPSFEEALQRLEAKNGQLTLAEALADYEEGVRHLKTCYDLLQRAERRIELLQGVDADGRAIAEPFADEATEMAAGPAARTAAGGKDQLF